MPDSAPEASRGTGQLDAIVIGAGVSGLYALHRLRDKMGMKVRVFERGDGVGGTWYWNRYPGCRCDVESLEYSYSFDPELEQEWHWPERYGNQYEILTYVEHVAKRFDLYKDIQFETRVTAAHYDRETNLWTIRTEAGESFQAPICIMATGNLSTPRLPDYKGVNDFKGKWYHTGMWPHEPVDFTGLRVGIIGTGSSGVQSIPIIARQAKHLTVFQRTANFSLPARNAPMDDERETKHKSEYRDRRRAAHDTPFGIAGYPPPTKSALEVPEAERNAKYESKWAEGGSISFLYSYTDLLTDKAANETAAEFVRNKIRSMVKDPRTAEDLCPNDHPIGTKRLILDTNYYETYNRDNVTLVNIRKSPIQEITETGLKTADGEYELDAIVFATGFDAMTGALREIDIRTSDGKTLAEEWKAGPYTMLGLMCAGFPNMFLITGPGSPGVKSQMILAAEQHTDWIVDCIDYMRGHGYAAIEPSEKAQFEWTMHVKDVADSTLYPLANSWYVGANIPGKARVFMPYVGGHHTYRRKCDQVAANGYDGFVLTPAGQVPQADRMAMTGDD